jgi:ATP synthase protein I
MSEFDKENQKVAKILQKKAHALNNRRNRIFYFNAAILSVYGWQMAIPVLLGIILGRFLDKHIPSDTFSWTLNLIIIGFVVGIFNANYWIRKEGIIKRNTSSRERRKK